MTLGSGPSRAKDGNFSRDRAFDPKRTALLIVDVQNATFNDAQREIRPEFFAVARDVVIPNLVKLIASGRSRGLEIIYTVIENLTRDGRDRGLDYQPTPWTRRDLSSLAGNPLPRTRPAISQVQTMISFSRSMPGSRTRAVGS